MTGECQAYFWGSSGKCDLVLARLQSLGFEDVLPGTDQLNCWFCQVNISSLFTLDNQFHTPHADGDVPMMGPAELFVGFWCWHWGAMGWHRRNQGQPK